ncbi:hypothetical protein AB0C34_27380 [Nocardia sp. NPDC049220]|uniref:hypothetical protein n=1 Tax=Nocardia sp. NPDC049220 TaxID=3155273 RepID=UPI0033D17619
MPANTSDPDARKVIIEGCWNAVDAWRVGCHRRRMRGLTDLCHPVGAELGVSMVDGVAGRDPYRAVADHPRLAEVVSGEFGPPPLEPCTGVLRSLGS